MNTMTIEGISYPIEKYIKIENTKIITATQTDINAIPLLKIKTISNNEHHLIALYYRLQNPLKYAIWEDVEAVTERLIALFNDIIPATKEEYLLMCKIYTEYKDKYPVSQPQNTNF